METYPALTPNRQRQSVPTIPTCTNESCLVCSGPQPDLSCTCGDKFHLSCIGNHVEQLYVEFECVQNKVGERLSHIEQVAENENGQNFRNMVETWVGENFISKISILFNCIE